MKPRMHIGEGTVVLAFVAVVALATLSWWTSTLSLGAWGMPVALVIAAAKVAVVGLFFMELGEHGGGVRVAALMAPAFVTSMLLAMLDDVWLR